MFGSNTNGTQHQRAAHQLDQSGVDLARVAMGIDWMSGRDLSQAIPPAFTSYIGQQLMRQRDSWLV